MASTTQAAKIAAQEDKKQTGPAGLPNTKPVGVKPRLSPEEKAKRDAQMLEDHIRLLQARGQQVIDLLKDMGIASLAGRIGSYDDVPVPVVQAVLSEVQTRVDACRAALESRTAKQPATAKLDLKAVLAAQTGTPAVGQTVPAK